MRRLFFLAIACAALASCSGGDDESAPPTDTESTSTTGTEQETGRTDTTTEPTVQPVALVPMGDQELRRCRRFPELAEACPPLVPDGRFGPGSVAYDFGSYANSPRRGAWTFTLQQGGENPRRPERNRPPALVHVVSRASAPIRTRSRPRAEFRDGLMEERRRSPLYLGLARWGGREGVLVLQPPYPLGGIESNHLAFRWAAGSRSVSLHAWEPFTEVPGVLRVVVESIPAE
jgi:hypothetical protein